LTKGPPLEDDSMYLPPREIQKPPNLEVDEYIFETEEQRKIQREK